MQAQQGHGRTVRDIVEHSHELVNEAFCRKIFRQLLQSLETQYATQMPPRAITPDTIAFQENEEPLLLPSYLPADEQNVTADLQALASVVHYAITCEWPPGAPLSPRRLAGYSGSLTGAVDKCLSPDPRQHPKSVDELRDLLGIVSLGPPPAASPVRAEAAAPPATSTIAATDAAAPAWLRPVHESRIGKLQRWALIGAAAGVLVAAAVGLLVLLRGTDSGDVVALTLPPAERAPRGLDRNEALMVPSADAHVPAAEAPPLPAAPSAQPQPAPEIGPPAAQVAAAPVTRQPARNAPAQPGPAQAEAAGTTYKLLIKPWGTVYVDGAERGVSPPLKRLTLSAGQHTVRVVNPNYPDRVLRIDAGKSASGKIVHDFSLASR